jgi:hypothetical protein
LVIEICHTSDTPERQAAVALRPCGVHPTLAAGGIEQTATQQDLREFLGESRG